MSILLIINYGGKYQKEWLKEFKVGMSIRSEEGGGRKGTAVFIYKSYSYIISSTPNQRRLRCFGDLDNKKNTKLPMQNCEGSPRGSHARKGSEAHKLYLFMANLLLF